MRVTEAAKSAQARNSAASPHSTSFGRRNHLGNSLLVAALLAGQKAGALTEKPGASVASDYKKKGILGKYTPLLGGEFRRLSNDDAMGLELASRSAEGQLLPSGVRVIEVLQGGGPLPAEGTKVYIRTATGLEPNRFRPSPAAASGSLCVARWADFKLWAGGFDKGMPIDASYFDTRPIAYNIGSPAGRVLPGIDLGIRGMREGGWRRLVIPPSLGYGEVFGRAENPRVSRGSCVQCTAS